MPDGRLPEPLLANSEQIGQFKVNSRMLPPHLRTKHTNMGDARRDDAETIPQSPGAMLFQVKVESQNNAIEILQLAQSP